MKRLLAGLAAVAVLGLCARTVEAQEVVALYPIERPVHRPVMTASAPVVPTTYTTSVAAPGAVSTAWEPAEPVIYTAAYTPTVAYAPTAACCTPTTVSYAPAVTYRAVTSYTPAASCPPATVRYYTPAVAYSPVAVSYTPSTYYAYSPVASGYAVPAAAAYPGRKVWVHPKVYVAGQPIRNLIRAITP